MLDGYFALPPGPGLGVPLDLDEAERHPRKRAFFDIYDESWHHRRVTVKG